MVVLPELIRELKALRKGRGLFVSHIGERIGSELRDICEVTDEDGPAEIRQKVAARLSNLADDLPADLRVAVRAAFALCPEARLPLYQDRVGWAAERLGRDPRTARRRIDDGIHQLAQLASISTVAPAREPAGQASGWHTAELRVWLALDRTRPEVLEHRRIVSDQDGLAEIDLAITLNPRDRRSDPRPGDLAVNVFYGGLLVDRGMESSDRLAFALALPRPLGRGESHEFVLQYRFADERLLQPHFACVPKRPCERFELRVRFDRERLPGQIWLLRNAFQRDIDDPEPRGETVPVDRTGEFHLTFRDLTPGLAHGARWDQPSDQENNTQEDEP